MVLNLFLLITQKVENFCLHFDVWLTKIIIVCLRYECRRHVRKIKGKNMAEQMQPTVSVKIVKGKYEGVIVSNEPRVPDATFTVDVPAKEPIKMDSYFNACIVRDDRSPVANTKVVASGDDWEVKGTTSEAGCLDMKIPSGVEFTIKAFDPETNKFSALGGTMVSADAGKLLNDCEAKVMPYDGNLMNVSRMTAEEGIISYSFGGDEYIVKFQGDMKVDKHSMVVHVPTEVGKSYKIIMNSDEPIKVWFSDDSRAGKNPANVTKVNEDVVFQPFIATKTETRLYLQAQNGKEITVKSMTIKEVIK